MCDRGDPAQTMDIMTSQVRCNLTKGGPYYAGPLLCVRISRLSCHVSNYLSGISYACKKARRAVPAG